MFSADVIFLAPFRAGTAAKASLPALHAKVDDLDNAHLKDERFRVER